VERTLNLYALVHDDPETFADLDGHDDLKYAINDIIYGYRGLQGTSPDGLCDTPDRGCSTIPGNNPHPTPAQPPPKNPSIQNPNQQSPAQQGAAEQQHQTQTQHTVRFEGNPKDVKRLQKSWKTLMKSSHARKLVENALKDRDLIVRPEKDISYYDPRDNSINVDPNFHPIVQTSHGPQESPTPVILGHELGHSTGAGDDGPGHMSNVNQNENPIRRDLGLPERTEY